MSHYAKELRPKFERIYQIELEYQPACWKLCGDGHCCHHTRYRNNRKGVQILPLMPGELAFLRESGHINQYSNPKATSQRFEFPFGPLFFEQLEVDLKNGGCPCTHGTRPTICRLYPLLPQFDPCEGIVGFDDKFTIYEEAEAVLGLPKICKVESVPFNQLGPFNEIMKILASEPVFMFYISLYQLMKREFTRELAGHKAAGIAGGIEQASRSLILKLKTGKVPELMGQINALADRYKAVFGERLQLEL